MVKKSFSTLRKSLGLFLFAGLFVLAYSGPVCAAFTNVATGGIATQSSTTFGGDPSRAIDGNTDGDYFHNSVSHTSYENGASWKVDLLSTYSIDHIVIWNRTDGWGYRIDNFYVEILSAAGVVLWSKHNISAYVGGYIFESMQLDMKDKVDGRYVRVGLEGLDYLQLAEVQVFTGSAGTVPLPGALWLLAPGLLGLAGLKRKYLG